MGFCCGSFLLQGVDELQYFSGFGDILHGMAIMDKPQDAGFVHQHLGRHAAELEEIDLLPVKLEYFLVGIGQTDEFQLVFCEILAESIRLFRSDGDDDGVSGFKLCEILMQLHHVPAAEGSDETTVEDHQDVLFFF